MLIQAEIVSYSTSRCARGMSLAVLSTVRRHKLKIFCLSASTKTLYFHPSCTSYSINPQSPRIPAQGRDSCGCCCARSGISFWKCSECSSAAIPWGSAINVSFFRCFRTGCTGSQLRIPAIPCRTVSRMSGSECLKVGSILGRMREKCSPLLGASLRGLLIAKLERDFVIFPDGFNLYTLEVAYFEDLVFLLDESKVSHAFFAGVRLWANKAEFRLFEESPKNSGTKKSSTSVSVGFSMLMTRLVLL